MKKWICEWERGRKAALQLGGKVRSDFSAKLPAKSQNKNSVLFCDFGRCGG
jgi:hypothetical protein